MTVCSVIPYNESQGHLEEQRFYFADYPVDYLHKTAAKARDVLKRERLLERKGRLYTDSQAQLHCHHQLFPTTNRHPT